MAHEAGYDAYMTGVVFLTLMKYCEVGKFLSSIPPVKEAKKKQGRKNK